MIVIPYAGESRNVLFSSILYYKKIVAKKAGNRRYNLKRSIIKKRRFGFIFLPKEDEL
jgi:hypothetical protein